MEWSDQFGQVSDDGCGHHEIADESQVVRVENQLELNLPCIMFTTMSIPTIGMITDVTVM
jgi:hypothetical protein